MRHARLSTELFPFRSISPHLSNCLFGRHKLRLSTAHPATPSYIEYQSNYASLYAAIALTRPFCRGLRGATPGEPRKATYVAHHALLQNYVRTFSFRYDLLDNEYGSLKNDEEAISLRPPFRQWCDEQHCYTSSAGSSPSMKQKLPLRPTEYFKLLSAQYQLLESYMHARTFAIALALLPNPNPVILLSPAYSNILIPNGDQHNGLFHNALLNRTLLKDPYDDWGDFARVSHLLKAILDALPLEQPNPQDQDS